MERLVLLTKEHIKYVHSNKILKKKTLVKRTAAFSGREKRAYQFDMTSDCTSTSIIRSQRHEIPSAKEAEKSVIDGLSRLKPFDFC